MPCITGGGELYVHLRIFGGHIKWPKIWPIFRVRVGLGVQNSPIIRLLTIFDPQNTHCVA